MENITNKAPNSQIKIINPISVNPGDKNPFVKQAIGSLWDFIDKSMEESNLSWQENIQSQISNVVGQTQDIKAMLTGPNGTKLDLKS